jgi:hypothetical protein
MSNERPQIEELRRALKARKDAQQRTHSNPQAPDPFGELNEGRWDESSRRVDDEGKFAQMYGQSDEAKGFKDFLSNPDGAALDDVARDAGNPELVEDSLDRQAEAVCKVRVER